MREILFRGKRLDNGEWVEGFYCCLKGGKYHYILTGMLDITHGYPDLVKHAVDPATVGQFTGLLDKAGKRIFEGDIFDWGYSRVFDMRYTVSYDAEIASFFGAQKCGFLSLGGINIEVIGNIHDNPELLKEGDTDGKERTE